MNDIQVSTITPCFRMKPYLKLFLEELPRQTMFDRLEVVLDHNEPDEEEIAWVREFQAKYPGRLKHIIIPKVEPIGTSMNRCIKEASGEYVTIWNVDDLRTDNSIELQYKALADDLTYGIAYGDFMVVRKFGLKDGRLYNHHDIPDSELTRSMVLGPFYMFRKSLCTTAGYFDEQLRQGADYDLAVRLAFHAKAVCVDGNLGYYLNEHKGASTRPGSLQPIEKVVIELRHGIFDKIDYRFLAPALNYSIDRIYQLGEEVPVAKLIPDYKELLAKRGETLVNRGIISYLTKRVSRYELVKNFAKKQLLALFKKINFERY
jgi:glycosyltransferase involved in cell wall biosynthesis